MTVSELDCWWPSFKRFTAEKTDHSSWRNIATENDFSLVLSSFLFSPRGARYKTSFKFSAELRCNAPAPLITASRFVLTFVPLITPDEHIPALTTVKSLMREAKSPYNISHHFIYGNWETDTIIGGELGRNILLSLVCVVVVTFLLLCDFRICVTVLVMVTMTLTNVIGFLHFWNTTIDIISCISIVLSIGLCVDYSVHIGTSYLVAQGNILLKRNLKSNYSVKAPDMRRL